jgi:two-component system cell cycle sensor histidine kinase/response regulator CckA
MDDHPTNRAVPRKGRTTRPRRKKLPAGHVSQPQDFADLFLALFEQAAFGVAQVEATSGRFVRVNQRFCDIVGYTSEEVERLDFQTITHPEDLPADLKSLQHLVSGQTRGFVREKRYCRKDGGVVWVNLTVSPLWRKGEPPSHNIAVAEDITDRKLVETELALHNRIAQVFLTVPDEEMHEEVLSTVRQALGSPHGVFGYLADNGDLVIPSMTRDIWKECEVPEKSMVFPPDTWGDTLWGRAIRNRQPYYANRDFKVPSGHIPVKNFLTVPVVFQNRTIGVLSVGNRPGGYSDEHLHLLKSVAGFISPILHARQQRDRHERESKHAEEALRRSESFTSSIVENEPECVKILGPRCELRYMNPAGLAMIEADTLDAVVGKSICPMVTPEHRGAFTELSEKVFRGESGSLQFEIVGFKGTHRWLETHAVPLLDPQGKVEALLGLTRDITERKRAEEQIRYQAMLLDQIRDAVTATDLEGLITYVNEAQCRALQLSREELIGTSVETYGADPQRGATQKQIIEATRTAGKWQGEVINRSHDGRNIVVEVRTTLIRDADGHPIGMCGSGTDITEPKRAEEAVRESEERYRLLFDGITDAVFVHGIGDDNLPGQFLAVNSAACLRLGYTREELLRLSPADVDAPESTVDVRPITEMLKRSEKVLFEQIHVAKDGQRIPVEISAQSYQMQGRPVVLSVARDITERKKAELERTRLEEQFQQAQKMESVGRLAGGVAHDFNNMLQVILGHIEFSLNEAAPGSRLRENLEEIQKSAQRSADLTRQLLAFARKQTVSPKLLDLNDTVSGMLKMLQRLIREDIQLLWVPGAGLWPILMDPSQVDQILANLAVNARDAIEGVGKVTIETANVILDASYANLHSGCVPGAYVMLAVSDSGRGMGEEIRAHLFEPFFTTKERGKGTGLGLATVFGIVKQNNGFISVRSEPGEGTSFRLYFPRAEDDVKTVEQPEDARSSRGTETLLLVEDEEQILNIGQHILEQQGYMVLAAQAPEEAIALAARHQGTIHLLITDVVMPGMDGKELKQRLAASRPGLKCLFMSGYTADVIVHHGVLDEGVAFLQKPFTSQMLAERVREVLKNV